jgi:type III secretion protein C
VSAALLRGRLRFGAMALACAAAFAAGGGRAQAAPLTWSGNRFVYATQRASIDEVLTDFAASQHVALRISGSPGGIVSGRFAMPPERFLDMLCASYGLVWYYDGAVLQVSAAGAQQPLAIRPNTMTAPLLRSALEGAGVADAHFPLAVNAAQGTLTTYGPASFLAQVRAAAERFEADARNRVPTTVRVVRLNVATAADKTYQVDGRTVMVAGVATRLRERLHRAPAPGATGLPLEFDAPLPVIEADATTNSILLRDRPERIDGDAALVADADVRLEFVSLQTRVVDVPSAALAELLSTLPGALAQGAPGWSVADDGAVALIAKLDALGNARRASVEVSRTALTLDRAPAVFDRHEARLVARTVAQDDTPDDAREDLWLSVEPSIVGAAVGQPVDLRVELNGPGGAADVVMTRIPAGQAMVLLAPGSAAASRRVIVLVPRIVA